MASKHEERKPASWRINAWREELSDPPPSRGTVYNWIAERRIEVSKIGDMTFILTSPQEFLEGIRVNRTEPEPAAAESLAEPEAEPVKRRGRGRPKGSKNRQGHGAGRPRSEPDGALPHAASPRD